jgi:undecaprenyl-diphosphatase
MSIPLGEAASLGMLEGITDVLPLSSSGHRLLARLLFGGTADATLTLLLHVAILAATVVVFRRRAWTALEEGLRGLGRPALLNDTPGGRDAVFVGIATLVSCVAGFTGFVLRKELDGGAPLSLYVVGGGLLVSAVTVLSARFAAVGATTSPGWVAAVVVGVAQGCALLPGLSRSGLTIVSLLWMGVSAERAFELSFLVYLPVLAGAVAFDAPGAFHTSESVVSLGTGALLAFALALGSLHVLRRVTENGKIHWFAVYLAPLAVATLAWGYARP